MLSPTDTESVIGILARSVCDHVGRRKLETRKGKKTTLVANAQQYAMMRAVQEQECRELQEATEYRNERHKRLMSMMERKLKLMGEIPEV